jgi:phosphate acetyltransferase
MSSIRGKEKGFIFKVATDVKVFAMNPENALSKIGDIDGCLLITPGDRVDNILTIMSAQLSQCYLCFSSIVLTGGMLPGLNVRTLFKGRMVVGYSPLC